MRPGCRSHCGCPRWSSGSHLACVARASPGPGEAQEGFARLEAALPFRLDIHSGSSIGGVREHIRRIGSGRDRMDPHKRSATIEVMTGDETIVGGAWSAPSARKACSSCRLACSRSR
jgi:hypothetical protein